MAGIGHIAIGVAAGRLFTEQLKHTTPALPSLVTHPATWMCAFTALSMSPDLDVLAFSFGIPYHAPWGHRGASHSLAFALICGGLIGLLSRPLRLPPLQLTLFAVGVMASHGLLDTLTDGGLGAALLWPFDMTRFFAPWRPIPVSPIGPGIFSTYGMYVIRQELLYFLPFFLYAFWPRKGQP